MGTALQYFRTHPVFTLAEFRRAVGTRATPSTTQTLIKYHLGRGTLRLVERGVYAVVPPGVEAGQFAPDRFLVAAALRPDAVLAYHSALELLGVAHSTYRDVFFLTGRRRKDLHLGGGKIRALLHPKRLRVRHAEDSGVEVRERSGVKLRVTGPERTLVDCLTTLRYAGGLEEVLQSLRGVPAFDLDRLAGYLNALDQRRAFAIVGAYLEQEAERLFVPSAYLEHLAKQVPRSPIYLARARGGGRFLRRWNLIVPRQWSREGSAVEV
jgi:predicted transcriptional regulator of viral defense system